MLAFFVASCSSSSVHVQSPANPQPSANLDGYQVSEITYELNTGWGINETDKIIFRSDGSAEYIANLGLALGGTYVPVERRLTGRFRGNVDSNQFQKLVRLVIHSDFFSRKDRYSSSVTDASTVTTSVQYAGGRKTVVNYGRGGDDYVGNIEREIISLARKIEWQKH